MKLWVSDMTDKEKKEFFQKVKGKKITQDNGGWDDWHLIPTGYNSENNEIYGECLNDIDGRNLVGKGHNYTAKMLEGFNVDEDNKCWVFYDESENEVSTSSNCTHSMKMYNSGWTSYRYCTKCTYTEEL
jgi:hypothetical protein